MTPTRVDANKALQTLMFYYAKTPAISADATLVAYLDRPLRDLLTPWAADSGLIPEKAKT